MTEYLGSRLFQNTDAVDIIPNSQTQKNKVKLTNMYQVIEIKRRQKKTLITEGYITQIILLVLSIINVPEIVT